MDAKCPALVASPETSAVPLKEMPKMLRAVWSAVAVATLEVVKARVPDASGKDIDLGSVASWPLSKITPPVFVLSKFMVPVGKTTIDLATNVGSQFP